MIKRLKKRWRSILTRQRSSHTKWRHCLSASKKKEQIQYTAWADSVHRGDSKLIIHLRIKCLCKLRTENPEILGSFKKKVIYQQVNMTILYSDIQSTVVIRRSARSVRRPVSLCDITFVTSVEFLGNFATGTYATQFHIFGKSWGHIDKKIAESNRNLQLFRLFNIQQYNIQPCQYRCQITIYIVLYSIYKIWVTVLTSLYVVLHHYAKLYPLYFFRSTRQIWVIFHQPQQTQGYIWTINRINLILYVNKICILLKEFNANKIAYTKLTEYRHYRKKQTNNVYIYLW